MLTFSPVSLVPTSSPVSLHLPLLGTFLLTLLMVRVKIQFKVHDWELRVDALFTGVRLELRRTREVGFRDDLVSEGALRVS